MMNKRESITSVSSLLPLQFDVQVQKGLMAVILEKLFRRAITYD
jgi:hypothetical protein